MFCVLEVENRVYKLNYFEKRNVTLFICWIKSHNSEVSSFVICLPLLDYFHEESKHSVMSVFLSIQIDFRGVNMCARFLKPIHVC